MDDFEVQHSRLIVAIAVSTIAGHLAGFIYHGIFGKLPIELPAFFVLLGGITGGVIRGRTFHERCWIALPFSILSLIQMFTTCTYLSSRGWIFIPEIIIASAITFVPFIVMYRIVMSHLDSPVNS